MATESLERMIADEKVKDIEIKKLKKMVTDRINLINMSEKWMDDDYKRISFRSLRLPMDYLQVMRWFEETNKRIDQIRNYYKEHGTTAQKYRLTCNLSHIGGKFYDERKF